MNASMIIEDSANVLWAVRDTGIADLDHVWFGVRVKKSKGAFVPVAKARETLVRKECTRVVAKLAA